MNSTTGSNFTVCEDSELTLPAPARFDASARASAKPVQLISRKQIVLFPARPARPPRRLVGGRTVVFILTLTLFVATGAGAILGHLPARSDNPAAQTITADPAPDSETDGSTNQDPMTTNGFVHLRRHRHRHHRGRMSFQYFSY